MFTNTHLSGAVDGTHIRLDNMREVPEPFHPQTFWCRKGYHSLNVLVFADMDHRNIHEFHYKVYE